MACDQPPLRGVHLGLAHPHLLALAARVLERRAALVDPAHRLRDRGPLRALRGLRLVDVAARLVEALAGRVQRGVRGLVGGLRVVHVLLGHQPTLHQRGDRDRGRAWRGRSRPAPSAPPPPRWPPRRGGTGSRPAAARGPGAPSRCRARWRRARRRPAGQAAGGVVGERHARPPHFGDRPWPRPPPRGPGPPPPRSRAGRGAPAPGPRFTSWLSLTATSITMPGTRALIGAMCAVM